MRPCPWCGCDTTTTVFDTEYYYVQCDGCWATGPASRFRMDAEEMWNGTREPHVCLRPCKYIPTY